MWIGVALAITMLKSDLDDICLKAYAAAVEEFPADKLQEKDVSVAVAEINRKESAYRIGGVRMSTAFYPASVVKAFYLAYAAHQIDTGALVSSPEFERAARDMIRDSNNDATGYIVDKICGTTPGPELEDQELQDFIVKRGAVNRWFEGLGFANLNAVNRTFNEGPYGREMQLLGEKYANRNRVTAECGCRLMASIALEQYWQPGSAKWMRELLHRENPQDNPEHADGQAKAYTGKVIPGGTQLYSKAGWTSDTRHDLAWVVMPDGREFAIAILTTKGSNLRLVSFIAARLFQGLGYQVPDPPQEVED